MPKRDLDLEIIRKGRGADRIAVHGDPDDTAALQAQLTGWLEGHKWSRGRWPEFELRVRYAGEGKVRKTIRAGR